MNRVVRGLALMTRGPDGKNLLAGTGGSNVENMLSVCYAEVTARGGSGHAEDWMAWALDRVPDARLLADLELRVASGQGGVSHPAVVQAIFDPDHPKMRARGMA